MTLLFYSFQPPLHTASSYGHHDIVQVLLNSGAFVDRFRKVEVNETNLFYFKCNLCVRSREMAICFYLWIEAANKNLAFMLKIIQKIDLCI